MVDEEIKKITSEEAAKEWEEYVRIEMNNILDLYLPIAGRGDIGIRYGSPILGTMEDGSDLVETGKADAVAVTLILRFEDPIDMPK